MKLVPTVGVTVVRDGKRIRPTIGKAFDFTKEEAEAIKGVNPAALRKPNNEDDGEATVTTATETKPSKAEGSQAKARRGKKAATANTADDEGEEGDEL